MNTTMHHTATAKSADYVNNYGLNRKLLYNMLRASGHTCEEAAEGLCAVEKVMATTAHGTGWMPISYPVLMNFVMPNVNGPKVSGPSKAILLPTHFQGNWKN
jgi:CheY-like chemotaxis protein